MIPTSTNVSVEVRPRASSGTDNFAVFVAEGGRICGDAPHLLDDAMMKSVKRLIEARVARGKANQVAFDLLDGRGRMTRVFVVGVGKFEKLDAEAVRQAGGALARAVRKHRISRIAIVPPVLKAVGLSGAEAVATGFLLASFDYDEYRGTASRRRQKEDPPPRQTNVTILATRASMKQVGAAVKRAQIVAESQNMARTIAHRPGNVINPPALAKVAQDVARQVGLKCRVLDENQMNKLGMGGILAVGAGSIATPPRMIVLEWKGSGVRIQGSGKARRRSGLNPDPRTLNPLLLVGKAITFDTGGISIKPAEKMGKMVFDKCGAMAVLGAMCAIARLTLPINVIGIMSSAENHISEKAYRPGDILRMYNGVTVEVTNTDAEGRLVLADALAWGIKTFKPSAVIDLATLTGGVVVALGRTMAGVMSNSDELVAELTEVGQKLTGEKIWRLPLGPEQRDQIKSDDADIVNSAGREAHPLQGGAFLSYFIPEDNSVPWAHLDIAGVADSDKDLPYYKKGATGWGVRTLVEWVAGRVGGAVVLMPETFSILLSGGIMLAAAMSDPRAVTLRWLRLAGIIALSMAGLAGFFAFRRETMSWTAALFLVLSFVAILGQLGFVQMAWRATQRAMAAAAFILAVGSAIPLLPQSHATKISVLVAASFLASACSGLALMDMLLGHAYLNAAQMTMKPFLRLNRALGAFLLGRGILSVAGTFIGQARNPQEMFWNLNGLYIGTRWLVGFIVAGVFVWMAHDCIKRRATQSATGILYVAVVLILIGEIIGLNLMSETGMPL